MKRRPTPVIRPADLPAMTEYVFTFEMLRQYPNVRSFIIKQPMKKSFGDSIAELIGGSKKGGYR